LLISASVFQTRFYAEKASSYHQQRDEGKSVIKHILIHLKLWKGEGLW